jgi:hypothetical protein
MTALLSADRRRTLQQQLSETTVGNGDISNLLSRDFIENVSAFQREKASLWGETTAARDAALARATVDSSSADITGAASTTAVAADASALGPSLVPRPYRTASFVASEERGTRQFQRMSTYHQLLVTISPSLASSKLAASAPSNAMVPTQEIKHRRQRGMARAHAWLSVFFKHSTVESQTSLVNATMCFFVVISLVR